MAGFRFQTDFLMSEAIYFMPLNCHSLNPYRVLRYPNRVHLPKFPTGHTVQCELITLRFLQYRTQMSYP